MSTPISVVGTIATVPKLIRTGAGVPLCSFRLASSERRYDRERGEWVENGTNWYSVTAFRSLAQHSHFSFQKGDRVLVSGRLRVRKWENKERSGTSVEIEADALGHELRWGTSRFAKQLPQPVGEASSSLPADSEPTGLTSESTSSDSTVTEQVSRPTAEPRPSAEPRPPVGIGWATVGSRDAHADAGSDSDSEEETIRTAEEELPLAS